MHDKTDHAMQNNEPIPVGMHPREIYHYQDPSFETTVNPPIIRARRDAEAVDVEALPSAEQTAGRLALNDSLAVEPFVYDDEPLQAMPRAHLRLL